MRVSGQCSPSSVHCLLHLVTAPSAQSHSDLTFCQDLLSHRQQTWGDGTQIPHKQGGDMVRVLRCVQRQLEQWDGKRTWP